MKKRLTLALLLAPALAITMPSAAFAQQAAPKPQTPEQVELKRVNDYIRAVATMTADFVQTDRNGNSLTGKLTLKQPGRIRFEYQKDVPMLIVADGRSLTVIDYEVRQVQRWPIRNSPLGALLDPDRDLSRFGRVVTPADPRVLTVDVRDARHPEYGTISLVFQRKADGPAGLELHGWVSVDAQNNRTSIRLSNHRYDVAIPDTAFRWRDPRPQGPRGR